MNINSETRLLGLIGRPVEGSLSPFIHNSIFKYREMNYSYLTFDIGEESLKESLDAMKLMDFKGFNVTIPHKIEIMAYLDELSPEAENIGAVNTVALDQGKFLGHNTDGLGFVKSLKDSKIDLKDKNILLLGAGGAAYSIAYCLLREDIGRLEILNRSYDKALALSQRLLKNNVASKNKLDIVEDLSKLERESIDILVNATSLGMYPMERESPIELEGFREDLIIYDIVYKPLETRLIKEGKKKGYRTFNGLDMLINQAVLSEEFWFKEKLDKKLVARLREDLEEYLGS